VRLYLASYLFGDRPDLFAGMVRGDRRGWVIANALDGLDEDRRMRDTQAQIAELQRLGLEASDFDLREHGPQDIVERFGAPDFLWVRGGNVFTLRAAMARSGIDDVIVRGLRADAFVYAGYSAGACVLSPDLTALQTVDPVADALAVYDEARFDGLGVLDRPLLPHLDSPGHPESEALGTIAERCRSAEQRYWALRDGQALLIDGSATAVV
jgi:dipeptidase E